MEISHLKNIFVIAIGFLLIFIAFGGLQTLQSSLNPSEGLGAVSLSVTYGGQIVSAILLAPFAIRKLGCKFTIAMSMICYIIYTLANFYPKWYTLIPASVILGLGGSPFWTAKCTYLTISARQYAEKAGKIQAHMISQYFGVFFFIFQSSRIWGNLISSLILNLSHGNGCGLIAVMLVTIFLDPIDIQNKQTKDEFRKYFWAQFTETLKQLQDKRQCLLIPLTIYTGVEQGFILSDYTKSYVTCTLGIQYVGYVIIVFGATTSICSYMFGKLSQYVHRIFFFMLAAITNIISIAALFLWTPHPDQLGIFFAFSGLWGISDSVWQALVNALYGILFEEKKEAAFANYLLWKSLGYVISFGYSSFLSAYVKLFIVVSILIVGMLLYGIVEYNEWSKRKVQISCATHINDIAGKI
ncbi:protein unc-93 homolog A-like [Discoglossus pictus]